MRILVDAICAHCRTRYPDTWFDNSRPFSATCPRCRGLLCRDYAYVKAPGVVPDSFPGGLWVEHGLCDQTTGAPVRYDSRTDMAKEAARRGLENRVEHTYGSRETQRFV